MSAEDHRREAAEHDARAGAHEAQYEPERQQVGLVEGSGDGPYRYGASVYNPTESHLRRGAEHRGHAEDHRAAAASLERFEEAECADFPPDTRVTCPLLASLKAIVPTEEGARLVLAPGVNAEAVADHIGCHLAHAATHGFEGMDHCPLYLRGIALERGDGALELRADSSSARKEMLKRLHTHVE
jgi:hypothetical protein